MSVTRGLLYAVLLAVVALGAFLIGRSDPWHERGSGLSSPPALRTDSASRPARPSVPSARREAPVPTDTPKHPARSPVRPLRRATVEDLLQRLRDPAVRESGTEWNDVLRALARVNLAADEEALARVLEIFADPELPFPTGSASLWRRVFSGVEAPCVGEAVATRLTGYDLNDPLPGPTELKALFELMIEKQGSDADRTTVDLLEKWRGRPSSTFVSSLVDGLGKTHSEAVQQRVAELLANENVRLSALRALVRMDGEYARQAAFDDVKDSRAYLYPQIYGPRLTTTQAEELRSAADSGPREAMVYFAALSRAPDQVRLAEVDLAGPCIRRAIEQYRSRARDPTTHQVYGTALMALHSIAPLISDPELIAFFRDEVQRCPWKSGTLNAAVRTLPGNGR